MNLEISNRQKHIIIDKKLIALFKEAAIKCLLSEEFDKDFEISLSLVDNEEIQELNKTYRGKDYATDVLSFPLIEFGDENIIMDGEKALGDIVISTEKAIEQAKEYNHSLARELGFLFIHSMFHLMGYDHFDDHSDKVMREKEKFVLDELGLKRE